MAAIIYFLCSLFSFLCAFLLFRSYRKTPSHLLFWSGLSFSFLTLNNMVLFSDLILFPHVDFNAAIIRSVCSALAGSVLLFGLIWELT